MKKGVVLRTYISNSFEEEFYQKFSGYVAQEFKGYYRKGVQLPLYADSNELEEAIRYLNQVKAQYILFSHTYFTKKEMDSIPFFYLRDTVAPLELEGDTIENYGTKYVDGKLASDVLIDKKYLKKIKWGYLRPERVVSEEVKKIIEDNQLTGIKFESLVKDYKGREVDPYYVISFTNSLPPISSKTWLRDGDNGVIYKNSELYYEKEKLNGALDFNLTFEHFNNWNMQYVIVTPKVKKVFKENGLRLHFEPIILVD